MLTGAWIFNCCKADNFLVHINENIWQICSPEMQTHACKSGEIYCASNLDASVSIVFNKKIIPHWIYAVLYKVSHACSLTLLTIETYGLQCNWTKNIFKKKKNENNDAFGIISSCSFFFDNYCMLNRMSIKMGIQDRAQVLAAPYMHNQLCLYAHISAVTSCFAYYFYTPVHLLNFKMCLTNNPLNFHPWHNNSLIDNIIYHTYTTELYLIFC